MIERTCDNVRVSLCKKHGRLSERIRLQEDIDQSIWTEA